jgi:hypothetical protein
MAAGDSLVHWTKNFDKEQLLFEIPKQPLDAWKKAANGADFCEFSRYFFSKVTERHLRYFLEREAANVLNSPQEVSQLKEAIASRIDDISRHAFETSKITQSFSAGWFNKNAKDSLPTDREIKGFLNHVFEKLREELGREVVHGE